MVRKTEVKVVEHAHGLLVGLLCFCPQASVLFCQSLCRDLHQARGQADQCQYGSRESHSSLAVCLGYWFYLLQMYDFSWNTITFFLSYLHP